MLERKGHEQNQSQRDLICLNLPGHEMRVSETWMALFFQMKWNGGPQVHGQIQSILFQIPSQTDSQHVELGFLGSSYVPSFPSSERITTRETSLACALLPVARLLDRAVNFSCTLSTCSITRPFAGRLFRSLASSIDRPIDWFYRCPLDWSLDCSFNGSVTALLDHLLASS